MWAGLDKCAFHRDFITALPVSEGMMTSGASAADVRQASISVLAIVVSAAGAACAVAKRSTSRLLVDVVEKSLATVQPAVLHALWPSRTSQDFDHVGWPRPLGFHADIDILGYTPCWLLPCVLVVRTSSCTYLAALFLKFASAPGLSGGRGEVAMAVASSARLAFLRGEVYACCTPYARRFPFLVPVQRWSIELPATTVGECRRRHSL